MRILVGWDDDAEFELLSLYLNVDENSATLARNPAEFLKLFATEAFDVGILTLTFPDSDQAFDVFRSIHQTDPSFQVIVASRPGEIYPLSKFIRHGLRTYVSRDVEGEFMFLLQTLLESTVEAKRADQARELARRLREEVDSVRRLQESILPRDLRALEGYEIAARYEPSQIRVSDDQPVVLAGGDYYHVFLLENRRLVLLVGDASGHGMKACMSIISMHTLINQIHDSHHLRPHEFVSEINRKLCGDHMIQGDGGFITLLYGFVEDGMFHWTSAGHPLPLMQNLATGEFCQLGDEHIDTGPPLGIIDDAEFATVRSSIPKGHRLLIYTDGLTEAFPNDPSPPEFGRRGVECALEAKRLEPLSAAVAALFESSNAFTKGAGRHDDTSLLLLERRA